MSTTPSTTTTMIMMAPEWMIATRSGGRLADCSVGGSVLWFAHRCAASHAAADNRGVCACVVFSAFYAHESDVLCGVRAAISAILFVGYRIRVFGTRRNDETGERGQKDYGGSSLAKWAAGMWLNLDGGCGATKYGCNGFFLLRWWWWW